MLDRLYYIFHSSVKSGFGHAERASFLLSFSGTAYIGAFCFLLIVIARLPPPDSLLGPGIFLVFGITLIYGASKYFVGTGRYRRIIDKYGSPRALSKKKRFLYRLIAFGLFTSSLALFIFAGITAGRYLNPW
jgi:hypothetical protein